jgi:hypothetical protein
MAKKGQIVRRGGKDILITDDKGSGRVVNKRDRARVRIKKATEAGTAPPIPKLITAGTPRTQGELNAARAKSAARKKKRVEANQSDAVKNEPTTRGVRKAFDDAAAARAAAEAKRKK